MSGLLGVRPPTSLGFNRHKEKRRLVDGPIDSRSAGNRSHAASHDTKEKPHSPYVLTATVPSEDRTSSPLPGRILNLRLTEAIHVERPELLRGVRFEVEDALQSVQPQVQASQATKRSV
ncbi:hypothetical protein HBI24_091280 [Parastagonospora nodorum]|nr:hypothetical protein HBI09_076320 [Parastagonospora nodorum]KAH4167125.1 hypothetical protein HBH43_133570 [Parastagonospora nodorum]KAH5015892.1 hypothetical protein HBI77_061510 [Parastagonospora nodorum]KAH5027962.1 hypothetical protein HBI74_114750 [Parastagonospora nodorum]KAH5054631.1 hypothetical protein HBH96_135950 [Parastagonospora nodorum]